MYKLSEVKSSKESITEDWYKGDILKDTPCLTKLDDWVKHFFGFSDRDIFIEKSQRERKIMLDELLAEQLAHGDGKIKVGERVYNSGWFVSPSIKEIKDSVEQVSDLLPRGIPRCKVVTKKNEYISFEVHQIQTHANALHNIDPHTSTKDGISDYIFNSNLTLDTVPSLLVRNYIVPAALGEQYNAYDRLDLYHVNGFLLWGNNPTQALFILKDNIDRIEVPCMLYTQVCGIDDMKYSISNRLIHQIYTNTAPFNKHGNGGDEKEQEEIIDILLEVAYTAAIGMGLLLWTWDNVNPKPVINLSMIGLGMCDNPIESILRAIRKSCETYKEFDFDIILYDHKGINLRKIESRLGANIEDFNYIKGLCASGIPSFSTEGEVKEFQGFSMMEKGNSKLSDLTFSSSIVREPFIIEYKPENVFLLNIRGAYKPFPHQVELIKMLYSSPKYTVMIWTDTYVVLHKENGKIPVLFYYDVNGDKTYIIDLVIHKHVICSVVPTIRTVEVSGTTKAYYVYGPGCKFIDYDEWEKIIEQS